jgi:DNA-binding NtrC family response regulator
MASATLLCIDDNPHLLELRKATLESYGYCIEVASSSYAAMEILKKAAVGAVLLEYKQQGLDAEAVACHIKRQFPQLPVILLSAYSEIPERILWLVDGYVMKSELPDGLVRIVQSTIRSAQTDCEGDINTAIERHDHTAVGQTAQREQKEEIRMLLYSPTL